MPLACLTIGRLRPPYLLPRRCRWDGQRSVRRWLEMDQSQGWAETSVGARLDVPQSLKAFIYRLVVEAFYGHRVLRDDFPSVVEFGLEPRDSA